MKEKFHEQTMTTLGLPWFRWVIYFRKTAGAEIRSWEMDEAFNVQTISFRL